MITYKLGKAIEDKWRKLGSYWQKAKKSFDIGKRNVILILLKYLNGNNFTVIISDILHPTMQ